MIKNFNQYNESLRDQMVAKSDDDIWDVIIDKDISEVTDILYDVYKKKPPVELIHKIADKFGIPKDFNRFTIIDILDAINFIHKYRKPKEKLKIENRVESIKSHQLNSIENKHTYVTRVNVGEGSFGTWCNVRVLPEEEDRLYKYLNDTIFDIEPIIESLRDQMVAKSEKEIKKLIGDLNIDINKEIAVKIWNPYNHQLVSDVSPIKEIRIDKTYTQLKGDFMDIYNYMEDYFNTIGHISTIQKIKQNLIKD